MSLYEKCVSLLIKNHTLYKSKQNFTSLIPINENNSVNMAIPSFINAQESFRTKNVYYISDLHLTHHILDHFKNKVSDKEIEKYIHKIVIQLFDGEFIDDIRSFNSPIVLFGGDISSCFALSEMFYRDFIFTWEQITNKYYSIYYEKCELNPDDYDENIRSYYQKTINHPFIYAILGNHELWSFDSYQSCEQSYKKLFDELGIVFLNNRICSLGPFYRYSFENLLIVGGLGFAGLNKSFNAEQGIYRFTVNRNEEIKRCEEWQLLFNEANALAKKEHCSLVVLSHNPIADWLSESEDCSNCFFFTGHTHRNVAYRSDNNMFVFSDNQVGYDNKEFKFKKAFLYSPRNPFAADSDGLREITIDEYKEYCRYINEYISGTKMIQRYIEKYHAKFFALKQNGYMCFLLISSKNTYICDGGRVKKLDSHMSIEYYMNSFMNVVNNYIALLSPLRRLQEELSSYIKSFGGDGHIHGTIVDIDFENHVMINTTDGTITFYNSPYFGLIKTYADMKSLIYAHCPELKATYDAVNHSEIIAISKNIPKISHEYECVDIKNSPYSISRKINALQRLFDKYVLRSWNSDFEIH